MDDNNKNLIMSTLMDIREDLGQIKAQVTAFNVALEKHKEDDKLVEQRVVKVENQISRARWMLAGVTLVLSLFWKGIELLVTGKH